MQLKVELPRLDIGLKFNYKGRITTIIGYHIEHDTDTNHTNATYRVAYEFAGQKMTATLPRSTVERIMLQTV